MYIVKFIARKSNEKFSCECHSNMMTSKTISVLIDLAIEELFIHYKKVINKNHDSSKLDFWNHHNFVIEIVKE